jgi:putative DNA primase/helicase
MKKNGTRPGTANAGASEITTAENGANGRPSRRRTLEHPDPRVAVDFLERLRPGGPWILTAILPDGKATTTTAHDAKEAIGFVRQHDGSRNIYYSVNPTRTATTKKAKKSDIAAIEYLLADLDPNDDEAPDDAKARYLKALKTFTPAATAIVDSGNGIQVLWKLAEPVNLTKPDDAAIADVEARSGEMMKALGCDDISTRNIDRIFRLPGTINLPNAKKRKLGRVSCATELIHFNGAAHSLDAFPKPTKTETKRVASKEKSGKERKALPRQLTNMLHVEGSGAYPSRSEAVFAFINQALRRGVEDDEEIISAILDETYEGKGIYEHCVENGGEDYIRRQIERAGIDSGQLVLDPQDAIRSARELVARNFTVDGLRTLHRHRNAFWLSTGSYYLLADDEVIASKIWVLLENALRPAEKGPPIPFKPSRAKVGEVAAALTAVTQIDSQIEPPGWLTLKGGPPATELFACGNGLLHLPTGKLHPPSPDYFNLNASEAIFDPKAPKPKQWLGFLDQLFGDDRQAIELLQDWFGYSLSPDTSQQKILGAIGPRRSGKGTIARVLTMLLGPSAVCGPTMSSLAQPFGLEPLITKSLAIVSDVRIGARTDKTSLTERLLSISGEDRLTVQRKFIAAWNGRLPTRIMMLSNELPTLADGSGAYAGRLLLLILTRSFYGKEDPALTGKLLAELSGILNWSIDGYRRLQKRGHFIQPDSAADAMDDIELLGSPVKAFIRECCDMKPGLVVTVDELWDAWEIWSAKEGRLSSGTKQWFGRNLRSAAPGVSVKRSRTGDDDDRERSYTGIAISAAWRSELRERRSRSGYSGEPM